MLFLSFIYLLIFCSAGDQGEGKAEGDETDQPAVGGDGKLKL